jgi:cytoskeletal protein RodZ
MPTLGELLKERRESRGITLADISDATRIGSRFLKAIEADNFSVLPGGIFTRSFIRAYARQIGMNEDEAIALYLQQTGSPTEETTETAAEQRITRDRMALPEPRSKRPLIFIVIGVVLVGAALLAWSQFGVKDNTPSNTAPPPPTAEITPQPPQPPPQNTTPPVTRPSPETTSPQSAMVVRLDAVGGDCWIRYQIDSGPAATGILKQGESKELGEAQEQVKLILGNRRNVELKINGRPAAFPPDTPNFSAQVVIARDNLQNFFQ